MTFSAGSVSYGQLANTYGKYALSCMVDAPIHRLLRFHPPGVDGNFVVRSGREGGIIRMRARYVGIIDSIRSQWTSDREGWVTAAQTVVADDGSSYDNCNLVSATQMTDIKGIAGEAGLSYFDVVITFTRD